MTNAYDAAYARALDDPDGFWGEAAEALVWTRKWDKVLDDSGAPIYRWFTGGELNTCYNCLDRHVDEGNGARTALIYDSPVTGGTQRKYSYLQLRDEVAKFAGVLAAQGVGKGDRVIIYMPMVPEAAIAMLACARLGAIHSVVFGGFASNELAVRIDDAAPKAIVSATCGIEVNRVLEYMPLLQGAIDLAKHKPDTVIILSRPECAVDLASYGYLDWATEAAKAAPHDCVPVAATDPLYILYTSGTTGEPKGVVRDNGGHAVALLYALRQVYGMRAGEVWWGCSDVGWVVGHSFIVYAPLLGGCTTVMFEGKPVKTPDAGAYWRVVQEHGVQGLFAAPTAFRAIRKEDPDGEAFKRYDVSSLRHLFVAGEKLDTPTYQWLSELTGRPVYDHWWQTETGWPVTAPCTGLGQTEVRGGSTNRPVPGYQVEVLDANSRPLGPDEEGAIVLRLPLPPGCAQTLWNDHP
ncbi:MAG TPA: propionyl-CoA synthetase, partial [Rhodospirillaceae bacterium]|nr:propionyl-CoA synthetase [Rhodospirillaceae bacterium]